MKKTVLVTAIGSFAAEAVIAGCRREGLRVVGCDIYPAEWVANSLDVDAFYRAPYAMDTRAYRKFLKDVCLREQVDFLLPLTDVEVDALQVWRLDAEADYAGLGAAVCISDENAIALCRDKEKTEALLCAKRVCRTIPGRRFSEIGAEEFARLKYPLVVKPRGGRSSQGLRIVEDKTQMAHAAEELGEEAERYLVQPRIGGSVITVDVVRSPESKKCVCLPRRELLRTLNGAGTSVCVFRDEELERQCRGIAAALNVRGCVNMEFIEADADGPDAGKRYFLECNPRFSGGVAFSLKAGYDMVKNHLRCFMGEEPEPIDIAGRRYIARRYSEYCMREETDDEKA